MVTVARAATAATATQTSLNVVWKSSASTHVTSFRPEAAYSLNAAARWPGYVRMPARNPISGRSWTPSPNAIPLQPPAGNMAIHRLKAYSGASPTSTSRSSPPSLTTQPFACANSRQPSCVKTSIIVGGEASSRRAARHPQDECPSNMYGEPRVLPVRYRRRVRVASLAALRADPISGLGDLAEERHVVAGDQALLARIAEPGADAVALTAERLEHLLNSPCGIGDGVVSLPVGDLPQGLLIRILNGIQVGHAAQEAQGGLHD